MPWFTSPTDGHTAWGFCNMNLKDILYTCSDRFVPHEVRTHLLFGRMYGTFRFNTQGVDKKGDKGVGNTSLNPGVVVWPATRNPGGLGS